MQYTRILLLRPVTFFLLFIGVNSLFAATPAEPSSHHFSQRPKIGLVLSGGGARGFAHIGVLKILKKNHIPVDYIVGTSMGSIIGGLYAIGLSPDEIEQNVKQIPWDKVFNDFATRDYKSFRRKQDDNDFFGIHRIGISDKGLQISPGLIEGQQIELALDRLAYPGFHIHNFDKFRIPYRAIATDISNGHAFIIRKGNLARAMRASMSVPGALPPIEIDHTLLVDGGIADNIPIDVIRKMGADIVIAVDVSAPLLKKKEIKSGIDVTAQLSTILTRRIADIQLKTLTGNDVLITPGAADISATDFDKYPALIKAGEQATIDQLGKLKKLALSDRDYAAYTAALPTVARKNPIIDFIEIKNKTSLRNDVIRVRIHQKIGQALNVPLLEQDLSYIYGLDYSGSVVYSLAQRDGKTGLIIYVRDRKWARQYLQFGLSIESAFEIQSITNFNVSYNKNDLNSLAGEFRATATLGSEPRISAEIYQPLDPRLDYFVAVKTGIKTNIVPTLIDDHIASIQRFRRNFISLSGGRLFKQTTELRLGLHYNDGNITSVAGPFIDEHTNFTESYYFIKLTHNSLDNMSFPNHGFFSDISFRGNRESLGADRNYRQIRFQLGGASTYKRYTVFNRMILDTTLDQGNITEIGANELFWRGGFLQLSGTIRNELFGQHFGLVESALYRRLGNITFLPMYAGLSLEAGNAWVNSSEIRTDNLRLAGSVFVGADTFLGPVYIAVGTNDQGETAFYFNLGISFLK